MAEDICIIRAFVFTLIEDFHDMIDYFWFVTNVMPLCLLPLASCLPILVIFLSFKINFQVQASFLLYVFLLGSLLSGLSGMLCLYRHITNLTKLEELSENKEMLISKLQSYTRTMLSTTSTSICIVKFFTKVQASRETVNNAGIGFFILMIFAKFCCVTILPPDVKFYSFTGTDQKMTFEIFELFESVLDLVCLMSTCLFLLITCNRALAVVQPINNTNEDAMPITQPLHLPSFPILAGNRMFLLISLQYQVMFEKNWIMKRIIEDSFVVLHALVTPMLVVLTNNCMRNQMMRWITRGRFVSHSINIIQEEEMEVIKGEEEDDIVSELSHRSDVYTRPPPHRPDSAPTRPSSAPMLQIPGGIPENSVRVPYRSNIRKHRSALETVVAAPRRRRKKFEKIEKKNKKGGPLDQVMTSMVGEKEIPLEDNDGGLGITNTTMDCKTM